MPRPRLARRDAGRSQNCAKLARLVGDDAARGACLRDAQRFYTKMRTTGHAERLARELEFSS